MLFNNFLPPALEPVHEGITALSLQFVQFDDMVTINSQHAALDVEGIILGNDADHFTGSAWQESVDSINDRYDEILEHADPDPESDRAFDAEVIAERFGEILHTAQDFYAHSNWIELGLTGLVDDGLSYWSALTPNTVVRPGVVLLAGDDMTPSVSGLGEGSVTVRRSTRDVSISFHGGQIFKGLVTSHFSLIGEVGSEKTLPIDHEFLAKDSLSATGSGAAIIAAAQQTRHEFKRLAHLICSEYGGEGVEMLLREMVRPDEASQRTARELIDQSGIDLALVIDTTGSMGDDIASVKASASEIVDGLFIESPCSRVAIVLYKDFGDSYVTKTQLSFSSNKDHIIAAINSITVGGGGDFREAVHSGIIHAIDGVDNLGEWRHFGSITKAIIQMGDAPPHNPEPTSQPEDTGYTFADVAAKAAAGGYDVIVGMRVPAEGTGELNIGEAESPETYEGIEAALTAAGFFESGELSEILPVNVYPIRIGSDASTLDAYTTIAESTGGVVFEALTSDDVVDAVLSAIDAIESDGVISGRKWNDDNANGVHDAGEEWLNGWTVTLYDNAGALVSTTITADFDVDGNGTIDPATETGWYRFNSLADGDYRVDETARPGWQQSYPIHPVAALAHQLDVNTNFRTTANNFQGWAGLNERWLQSNSGWHYVTPAGGLFKWINGRGDTLRSELVAKLDPTYYNDLNLLAAPTAPQGHRITITAGSQVTNIDFGNYGASTIQGQKWEDSNADGVRAGSERLLNGWEIQLIDAVSGSVVQSRMTRNIDLNLDGLIDPQTEVGVYQFTGLIPGKYEVREVPKAGWLQSTPTQALRQLAYNIDTSRAFQTSNGNFLNWGNLSEKWLLGNDGWYFITPDGVLSKWNQSPRTSLTGTKVAELSPWFYAQTDRLTNAVDPSSSLIDTSTEVHVTGADFGNYRANGASGLKVTGRSSPTLTPGNVTVTISRGDIRVTGDRWHNQVGLFVDWKGNLVAVGLQGTTVNGKSDPVILQADSSSISGSIFADMNAGDDLIALQGFGAGKNVRVDGGNGADSVFMLDMQIGGNVDVLSGWGAGTIAISNSSIAKNLTIYGSEAEDDVVLDRVTVSNRTNIQMGASGDRLISSRSIFHDAATMSLGAGNDMMLAVAKNDFKRLLSVNGNAGRDSASTSTVIASRKAFAGIEATDVPNVSAVLDDVLAELATLGLEETLLP